MSAVRRRLSIFVPMAVAIGSGVLFAPRAAGQQAPFVQKTFASPEDAVKALLDAVRVQDKSALQHVFGPEVQELLSDDEAQDEDDCRNLAAALKKGVKPLAEGVGRVILEIGANRWPFPVPLVKAGSAWHFDAAAGKAEIVSRRIGKDELRAIGVLLPYIQAQRQYGSLSRDSSGTVQYARKLKSTPGAMDGLYWKTSADQLQSPFGEMVAEADAGGDAVPKPFHGYFFKVLTRQGDAAPRGRMDYIEEGRLTGGFALTAYPESWGRSGIRTFIVNQDGKIYQRDFGEQTSRIAAAMTEYNPGGGWTPVNDRGMVSREVE